MRKKITIIAILILTVGITHAQQQHMFTQYMFNGLAINPAYAGSHEALSVTVLSRLQWVGLEGAPSTHSFAIHGPLKKEHIAVGALVVKDVIGVTTNHSVYGSFAYKIEHRDYHISFGLQGGFSSYNTNLSNIRLTDADDLPFLANGVSSFIPNIGAGVYFYLRNLYAGFSIPELIIGKFNQIDTDLAARQVRHYYLTWGAVLPLNHAVKWKPNILVKLADRSKPSIDLNSSLLFNDVIWFGVSYRVGASVDLIFELQLTDQLRFGYAFDIGTTNLKTTNAGSHEFVLNYRISKHARRLQNPRHF